MSKPYEDTLTEAIAAFKDKMLHTPTTKAREKLQREYNKADTLAEICFRMTGKDNDPETLSRIKETIIRTITDTGIISMPFAKVLLPAGKHSDYHYVCEMLHDNAKIAKNRTTKWFERNLMDENNMPRFTADRIHMLILLREKYNKDTDKIPVGMVCVTDKQIMSSIIGT